MVGTPADQTALALSPDGTRVAVSVFEPTRLTRDIWIHDFGRGVRTRFTVMPGDEWSSAWSPDGKHLTFSASVNGILDLYPQGRRWRRGRGTARRGRRQQQVHVQLVPRWPLPAVQHRPIAVSDRQRPLGPAGVG